MFLQEKLNGQIYIDNVINNSIVPLFAAQPQLTLMQDGAIPHTARIVADHLANLGIAVLPWPSKSSDLNPIEHLWDQLEMRARARQQPQTSLAELRRALQEELVAIPDDRVRRLTISMLRRCLAVMAANDGHNRY